MTTNLSKKGYDFFAYFVHNEKTVGTTRDFISKEYTAFLNVLIESTLKLGQVETRFMLNHLMKVRDFIRFPLLIRIGVLLTPLR